MSTDDGMIYVLTFIPGYMGGVCTNKRIGPTWDNSKLSFLLVIR